MSTRRGVSELREEGRNGEEEGRGKERGAYEDEGGVDGRERVRSGREAREEVVERFDGRSGLHRRLARRKKSKKQRRKEGDARHC